MSKAGIGCVLVALATGLPTSDVVAQDKGDPGSGPGLVVAGPEDIPGVVRDALEAVRRGEEKRVVDLCGAMGDAEISAIVTLLESGSIERKWEAVRLVEAIGFRANSAVPGVLSFGATVFRRKELDGRDVSAGFLGCIEALASIGKRASGAMPQVVTWLRESLLEDPLVESMPISIEVRAEERFVLLKALISMEGGEEEASPFLLQMMNSVSWLDRYYAASVSGLCAARKDPQGGAIRRALMRMVLDEEPRVRAEVLDVIERGGIQLDAAYSGTTLLACVSLIGSEGDSVDEWVRDDLFHAVRTLAAAVTGDRGGINKGLWHLLKDDSPIRRARAVLTLEWLGEMDGESRKAVLVARGIERVDYVSDLMDTYLGLKK